MASTVSRPVEVSSISTADLIYTNMSSISQTVSDVPQSDKRDDLSTPLTHKSCEEMDRIAYELGAFHSQADRFDALFPDFQHGACYTLNFAGNPEFTELTPSPNSVLTPTTSSSMLDGVSQDRYSCEMATFSNTNPSIAVPQPRYSKPQTGSFYIYPQTISDSDLHDDANESLIQDTRKARTVPSALKNDLTLLGHTPNFRKPINANCNGKHYQRKTPTLTTSAGNETYDINSTLRRWLESRGNEDIPTAERLLQFN